MCILCKVQFHRDHFVLTLDDKIRQVRNRLEFALERVKADSKSIDERQSDVAKSLQACSSATEHAQKQMRQQYNKLVAALARRYCDQVILLNKTKEDQIVQFSEEMTVLQNLSDEKNILFKTVEALLDQPFTDEVFAKAENVLSQNQEALSLGEKDKWWNRDLYKPPALQSIEFSEQVVYLLGHFDVNDDVTMKADEKNGQENKKSKTNISLGSNDNIPQHETSGSRVLEDQEKDKSLSLNEQETQERYEQSRECMFPVTKVSVSKSQPQVQCLDFKNEWNLKEPKSLLLIAKSKYHNNH